MKTITPAELKGWQQDAKNFILLDVRETWEHEQYSIGGQNIPLGDLMAHRHEWPADATIVIYCEKGIRSAIAIQRLEPHGFSNLYNLHGGMTAWRKLL